jgi:probable HAF family extracellular repeat protein
MTRPLVRHCASAMLALATFGAQAAIAPRYAVTDLGNFFATGVNDSGWVSGYDGRAVLWRPGEALTDLGSFGSCGGGCSNRANAINNEGVLVGFTWSSAVGAYRAFQWDAGVLTDLGDLPGGANASRAEAVNGAGLAAGSATGQFSGHPAYGNLSFSHTAAFGPGGSVQDLEPPADATLNSIARGINDGGVIVGERQTNDGWRAIVWDGGATINLGAAWGLGGTGANSNSFARDVNNDGLVALQLPLGGGLFTAAVWQPGIGFTAIDPLYGASNAIANAVNDDGVVVGHAGAVAFAWSFADGLIDLNDRLDPLLADGWQILDATGLSENGYIAGRGWHPSLGYRAILMTPVPEPSAALLALLGLGWLRLRMRRPAAA